MESPDDGGDGGRKEDEAQLLERVHASARAMARRLVKSRDRADDIAQDAAAECLTRLRGGTWDVTPERLDAYVATIVWRRRSLMRSQRRQAAARDWTYLSEIAASTRAWMDPETQWQERELAALYNTTLQSLPPRCRQAFIAVREHGQSYAGAARTLGVSEKMIAKFITQAQRGVPRSAPGAGNSGAARKEEGDAGSDGVRQSHNAGYGSGGGAAHGYGGASGRRT